jgi:hypothetical protein
MISYKILALCRSTHIFQYISIQISTSLLTADKLRLVILVSPRFPDVVTGQVIIQRTLSVFVYVHVQVELHNVSTSNLNPSLRLT